MTTMTCNCEWGNCFCHDCQAAKRREKEHKEEARTAAEPKAKAEKEDAKAQRHIILTDIGKDCAAIIDSSVNLAKAELHSKCATECATNRCEATQGDSIACALCGQTPQTWNRGNPIIEPRANNKAPQHAAEHRAWLASIASEGVFICPSCPCQLQLTIISTTTRGACCLGLELPNEGCDSTTKSELLPTVIKCAKILCNECNENKPKKLRLSWLSAAELVKHDCIKSNAKIHSDKELAEHQEKQGHEQAKSAAAAAESIANKKKAAVAENVASLCASPSPPSNLNTWNL